MGKDKNTAAMENFSSTAQLTPEQGLKSAESLEEYDPFAHRKVDKPTNDFGAFAHLLKSSIGSGILAMPMAFKNGGLTFSMVMTIVVGFICTHCVQQLVNSSHTLCRRAKIPVLDFSETAYQAFRTGPPSTQKFAKAARACTKTALASTYLMAASVSVVLMSTTVQKIVIEDNKVESWKDVDVRIYILMFWVPLLCLGLVKDLKYLVPFSTLANCCISVVFGVTLYYMFDEINDPARLPQMGELIGLPAFFSTVIYAMEGIGIVMPIENSMKNPTHFTGCPGILNFGMSIVVILYSVIGFFGYMRFGNSVKGTITLNLPANSEAAMAVQYLLATTMVCSFAMQIFVPTPIIWDAIKHRFNESRHSLYFYLMRMVLITGTILLAVAVPNLGPIINLVGAVCFSILGLTLPTAIEMATRYQIGYGKYNWVLWKDGIIFVLSILALLFGTYTSILDIIKEYSGENEETTTASPTESFLF